MGGTLNKVINIKMRNTINKLQSKFKAFIPQHIKNTTVMTAYDLMRRYGNTISEKRIMQNAALNAKELHGGHTDYFTGTIKYIENQSQWEKIRFGKGKNCTMSHSGCGIIAAYNAMAALNKQVSPEVMVELIGSFERDGAALGGRFGVAPSAIYDYFVRNGYEAVITKEKNVDEINRIGESYDVVIVTAYNDEMDITAMIHTVCITKAEDGAYVIHNGYHRDADSGRWDEKRTGKYTLAEAISQIGKKSAAIIVIGINRR